AAIAEKEKDTHCLALAAVTHPDAARGRQLASVAVSLDPSLTWIYTSGFGAPASKTLPTDWLSALHSYDPQNGYPFLMAADGHAEEALHTLIMSHASQPGQLERLLASDTKWQQLMRQAVLAPKYNDYFSKRRTFAQEAWSRRPSLPPGLVLFALWRYQWPN